MITLDRFLLYVGKCIWNITYLNNHFFIEVIYLYLYPINISFIDLCCNTIIPSFHIIFWKRISHVMLCLSYFTYNNYLSHISLYPYGYSDTHTHIPTHTKKTRHWLLVTCMHTHMMCFSSNQGVHSEWYAKGFELSTEPIHFIRVFPPNCSVQTERLQWDQSFLVSRSTDNIWIPSLTCNSGIG